MIPFKQFFNLREMMNGTYVEYKLSSLSAQNLLDFCAHIPDTVRPETMHCTVLYSRQPAPRAADHFYPKPVTARAKKWTVFPMQSGSKCLVLEITSEGFFEALHTDLMVQYGATHDYPSYLPHITVSYDYKGGELPSEVPTFDLVFDEVNVKPLDPEFKPGK